MTINVDRILKTKKPWDLSVEIDGEEWKVRRVNSDDFKRISGSSNYDEASNREFIAGLFASESQSVPAVEKWDSEIVAAVMSAVITYYQFAVIQKNFELANAQVAEQLKR